MGRKVEDPSGARGAGQVGAVTADGNTPQKRVRRARIVLPAGEGIGKQALDSQRQRIS